MKTMGKINGRRALREEQNAISVAPRTTRGQRPHASNQVNDKRSFVEGAMATPVALSKPDALEARTRVHVSAEAERRAESFDGDLIDPR